MAPCNTDYLIKFLTDPDVIQSLKDLAIYAEVASWIAGGDRCCNAGLPAKLKISFDCKDCLELHNWGLTVAKLLLIRTGVVDVDSIEDLVRSMLQSSHLCGCSGYNKLPLCRLRID